MSLYLPRLPLQLDPLIAEARRRARRRRLLVIASLLVLAAAGAAPLRAALAGANANAAVASNGPQCTPHTSYGTQCVSVRGSGLQVTGIQTWFDATGMFWPNLKWRIDLERYDCDPTDKTKATCSPAATWLGRVRVGDVAGPQQTALGAHFVQSARSHYWPALSLPHTFRSNLWLCTEVAVLREGTRDQWTYNAAGLTRGLRACVSVHR